MASETDREGEGQTAGWMKAKTLAEALPFIQIYNRSIVVIKYGGHAMGEEQMAKHFAADCVLLKMLGLHPVIVHGGGPQISAMLERFGIKSTFVDGLRVTDAATVEVAELVLCGAINKEIANLITLAGKEADVRGVGLSGKDARLITVEKSVPFRTEGNPDFENEIDLGFVGEPTNIDPKLIKALIYATEQHYIPVIAPIGVCENGETYNINADTLAGALAVALQAKRVLLLTNVSGVLDQNGELIRQMTASEAQALIADGIASAGMIPKLNTTIAAINGGVEAAVIMDGRQPHVMFMELFTKHGAGTLVRR